MNKYPVINNFLVKIFNEILKTEEKALTQYCNHKLSIREIHVIEAVYNGIKSKKNTVNDISKVLSITPGSLTVCVNTLIGKGYIEKAQDEIDKRIVRILPTNKAESVNDYHIKFHQEMVSSITSKLNHMEIEVLIKSLDKIANFFEKTGEQ